MFMGDSIWLLFGMKLDQLCNDLVMETDIHDKIIARTFEMQNKCLVIAEIYEKNLSFQVKTVPLAHEGEP